MHGIYAPVDLHPSKTLFSLDTDNLQLHRSLGLGALFCLFFCPLDQPCTRMLGRRANDFKTSKSTILEPLTSLTSKMYENE